MERKQIVKLLSEHFGIKAKYLAAPSFAYEIKTEGHTYTIDREGKIMDEAGKVIDLMDVLNPRAEEATEDVVGEVSYEITLPMEGHDGKTLKNMLNMLYSKQELIKKALGVEEDIVKENFSIGINDVKVETFGDFKTVLEDIGENSCPGINFDFNNNIFTFKFREEATGDEIKAATDFIGLLSKSAKTQKYASSKVKPTTNEKYTFRTWLLRLGMVGGDFKDSRRELLKNLTGNGAFKGGRNHET